MKTETQRHLEWYTTNRTNRSDKSKN